MIVSHRQAVFKQRFEHHRKLLSVLEEGGKLGGVARFAKKCAFPPTLKNQTCVQKNDRLTWDGQPVICVLVGAVTCHWLGAFAEKDHFVSRGVAGDAEFFRDAVEKLRAGKVALSWCCP